MTQGEGVISCVVGHTVKGQMYRTKGVIWYSVFPLPENRIGSSNKDDE